MEWNEVESTYIKWDTPKTIEGEFVSFGEEEDTSGRPLGVINISGKEHVFSVPTNLKLLERIAIGSYIRIEYLGATPTKRGFFIKNFHVWVGKKEV